VSRCVRTPTSGNCTRLPESLQNERINIFKKRGKKPRTLGHFLSVLLLCFSNTQSLPVSVIVVFFEHSVTSCQYYRCVFVSFYCEVFWFLPVYFLQTNHTILGLLIFFIFFLYVKEHLNLCDVGNKMLMWVLNVRGGAEYLKWWR